MNCTYSSRHTSTILPSGAYIDNDERMRKSWQYNQYGNLVSNTTQRRIELLSLHLICPIIQIRICIQTRGWPGQELPHSAKPQKNGWRREVPLSEKYVINHWYGSPIRCLTERPFGAKSDQVLGSRIRLRAIAQTATLRACRDIGLAGTLGLYHGLFSRRVGNGWLRSLIADERCWLSWVEEGDWATTSLWPWFYLAWFSVRSAPPWLGMWCGCLPTK